MRAPAKEKIARNAARGGHVRIVSRSELADLPHWAESFSTQRKDHRYYELIEDTIHQEFDYKYFVILDEHENTIAIQPFFILEQDLLGGLNSKIKDLAGIVRRFWPRLLLVRTLMVGCVAGEGHLDEIEESPRRLHAEILARDILACARTLRASLIVLKEFPAEYRSALRCFLDHGFVRIPSFPMTRLNIDYASFDDYMTKALSSSVRRKLRKKLNATAQSPPIEMNAVRDITPAIDEIYPLYLQVYERSKFHFEKLTKQYLCGLGQHMPDKVRFFVWRLNERAIAFGACMIQKDEIYAEYIGLDYSVALQLHLYHYVIRDIVNWAIANGYKWLRSSGLNYDPKLHLRARLDPLDLYVRHESRLINAVLKRLLPWLEPTRYDKTLPKFPNYTELWDRS